MSKKIINEDLPIKHKKGSIYRSTFGSLREGYAVENAMKKGKPKIKDINRNSMNFLL